MYTIQRYNEKCVLIGSYNPTLCWRPIARQTTTNPCIMYIFVVL